MKEIERLTPKQEFLKQFQNLHEAEFLPPDWTPEKRTRVAFLTSASRTKTAIYTSIPMECQGSKCPFANTCGLLKEDLAPIGYPCPYEMGMVKTFMADYIEDLDIDVENSIELCQVRDIVDIEVQYLRKTKALAKEYFIQENVVGVDGNGDPIFSKQLHLGIELEDKLAKRKAVILKQFLATRESKAKAGLGTLEQAVTMATMMQNFREMEFIKEKALKDKLGIVDVDEYIDIDLVNEDK